MVWGGRRKRSLVGKFRSEKWLSAKPAGKTEENPTRTRISRKWRKSTNSQNKEQQTKMHKTRITQSSRQMCKTKGSQKKKIAHTSSQAKDDDEVSALHAILGRQVGQRKDMACDEDAVDVSVGADVDAVVGVGVHGQGVNLGVGLGVGLVVGSALITSLDS